jgi:hypothetical protein
MLKGSSSILVDFLGLLTKGFFNLNMAANPAAKVPKVKLNNGLEMPMIGLGTYGVSKTILNLISVTVVQLYYNVFFCVSRILLRLHRQLWMLLMLATGTLIVHICTIMKQKLDKP